MLLFLLYINMRRLSTFVFAEKQRPRFFWGRLFGVSGTENKKFSKNA